MRVGVGVGVGSSCSTLCPKVMRYNWASPDCSASTANYLLGQMLQYVLLKAQCLRLQINHFIGSKRSNKSMLPSHG